MKIAMTADLHLSGFSSDATDSDTNLPERLAEKKKACYGIIEDMKSRNCNILVIAGDLLHNKSVIYSIAQSMLIDFFRENPDIVFIIFDGNHDLSGKGKNVVSSLKTINESNVIRLKKEGTISDFPNFFFVPFSMDISEIVKKNRAKNLVSHFGVSEAMLNSGASIISDISLKDLTGRYENVFLGHYHLPQEVERPSIKVYYAGSITQTDWTEKHENKRFLIFDTETNQVESILTKGYRKHYELVITAENREEIITQARALKENRDYVIIKKEEVVDTSDLSKEFVVVDKTDKRGVSNRGVSTSMSDLEKIKRYEEVIGVSQEEREDIEREYMDVIQTISGME